MRRWVAWLILGALWLCSPADAANVVAPKTSGVQPVQATLVDTQTINATGSYSSDALDLATAAYLGAWYLCTSALGVPSVTIEWLEAPTLTDADFVSVVTLEAALTAETPQLKQINPPPARYGRIKVTGTASNPADTVCTVKVLITGGAQ